MNPLYAARSLRLKLMIRWVMQFTAAIGLGIAGLSAGSRGGIAGLLICLMGASIFIYFGGKTFGRWQKQRDFAQAQRELRFQIKKLTTVGWVLARQRKLPESCRGSVVIFTKDGDLAFVIGLSGLWPSREALVPPQRVAEHLSHFGVPHIPVCLAAFVTSVEESFNFGVLAVGPNRFCPALNDAVESYREQQDMVFNAVLDQMTDTPEIDEEPSDELEAVR